MNWPCAGMPPARPPLSLRTGLGNGLGSRLGLLLAGMVVLLVTAGCAFGRRSAVDPRLYSYQVDPDIVAVTRIVMVPLYHASGVGRAARSLDEATATAWRELGQFEILVVDQATRSKLLPDDVVARRNIPAEGLRRLREQYRADAVLVGRIEHFTSFDPISAGVVLHLIDCRHGRSLWTATCHFDGGRGEIQRDIRAWHRATLGDGLDDIGGWQNVLYSPRLFARYLSDRLAESVLRAFPASGSSAPRPPNQTRSY